MVTLPPIEVDMLWSKVRPDMQGLVPCVAQDVKSRRVLMVAWVNKEALSRALHSGWATYWSRSRKEIWEKGASSGHRQRLLHVRLDCDGDTLVYTVEPLGPACHEGYDTCFSWRRVGNGWRREPEPIDYPEVEHGHLTRDLLDLVEAPVGGPKPRAASKAIRLAAPIEQRARALASALQVRQTLRLPGLAAELFIEVLRILQSEGVTGKEIREVLEGHVPTVPSEPAPAEGEASQDGPPPPDEPRSPTGD